MNPSTMDSTGSKLRPAPVPLDGSPTKRPLRSALLIILALGSLSMLAAFPGTASGQITAAKDCVTAPSNNLGSWTSTCTDTITITGFQTVSGSCIAKTGSSYDITSTSPASTAATVNPQTVCLEYKDAAKQYASGYAACSIPDDNQCGSSGITYSEATQLPTATLNLPGAAVDIPEGGQANMTVGVDMSDSQATIASDIVINITSNNSDVTLSSAQLTFTDANKSSPQSIAVSAGEDNDTLDDSATITFTPASTSGAYIATATKTVGVTDNDEEIILSNAAVTLTEGGADGSFTVALFAAPSGNVALSVTSADTGAVTVSPATLTFTSSNYATAQTVTVSPVDDNDGTDESVTITVSVTTNGVNLPDVTKTITVADDDGEIEVSSGAVTLTEGGAAGTFTVKLGAPPASSATITVTSGDTGAVTVSPTSLTFSAASYATAQTVTVTGVQDSDGTDDSATITVGVSSGYTASDQTKTVSVTDDDGGIVLSSAAVTAIEGGAAGTFTVTLSAPPASSAVISVTSGDTNTVTVSPATLTFSASNYGTAQTVTVTGVQDSDDTDDSATITVGVSSGYTASDQTKTVSVTDDDDGVIEVESGVLVLTEGGSADTFTVRLTAPPAASATLSVMSSDRLAVTVSPATLTFTSSNYDAPQTVSVSPMDDNDDTDESAIITVAASTGYTASDARKSITVIDDDGNIEVSSGAVELTEGADTSTGTFTVALSEPPIPSATLLVISGDTDAVTALPSALTFTSSDYATPQTVTVTAMDDEDGSDESVAITLATTAGYTASSATKSITVKDDDGSIEIDAKAVELIEGGDPATFTVRLAAPPVSNATLSVKSGDTGAVTVSPSTLTFIPSNYYKPQTVTLTPLYDVDETDETVVITLSATAGYAASDATKRVVVKDDDGRIEVSSRRITLNEGGSVGAFTVKLASAPASSATIDVTNGDSGAVTVSPTTLTFTPSNFGTAQTVTLTAIEDEDGTDESVVIAFTSSDGYPASGLSSTIEVIDDDGRIEVSSQAINLTEGKSPGTFTVKLGAPPALRATVSVKSEKPGSLTVSPKILTFTDDDYDEERTVTLIPVDDADAADESIAITLSATAGYRASDETKNVAVSDDEVSGSIVIEPAGSLTVDEGGSGIFTVKLGIEPKEDATIRLSSDNEDIRLSPTSLSFGIVDWNEEQTVLVIADPDNDAISETATITLVAEEGIVAADQTKAVSITDGLSGGMIVVSPAQRLFVGEGGSVVLLVTLGARPEADTTVSLSNPGGGLMFSPTSLHFDRAHWNRPQTVTVDDLEDDDAIDESKVIVLSAKDFSERRIVVEVKDGTDPLPTRARTLALPPSSVSDDATLRIRCKQDTPCLVFLDCNAQEDGSLFEGWIHDPIPADGARTLTVADIEGYVGGSWSGKGRLGCALRSAERISAQVWTRSGDGVLVNNSAVIRSFPEKHWHRADIESIPSPDGPEESNLRVRCLAPQGLDCTRSGFSCFDDEGTRYDVGLGAIGRLTVHHMQSEELAAHIGHRWTGLGLSCEFRSDHPFTVQVMTRTGGGGALVNNSATGEMQR